jgi:hypothetical protein
MLLASSGDAERTTAWDYDARLAENFGLTFGELVTKFRKQCGTGSSPLADGLDEAVDKRNDLAHRYFWDRAERFGSASGRDHMIAELHRLGHLFESLDTELEALTQAQARRRGLSAEVLEEQTRNHLERVLAGVEHFHSPSLPPNPLEIVAAYEWRGGGTAKCGLVFASRDSKFLILGEKGICYGPQNIPLHELVRKAEFDAALPALVNPRPKKAAPWNFAIQLRNGYILRARPDIVEGKAVVRFGLRKVGPMATQLRGIDP